MFLFIINHDEYSKNIEPQDRHHINHIFYKIIIQPYPYPDFPFNDFPAGFEGNISSGFSDVEGPSYVDRVFDEHYERKNYIHPSPPRDSIPPSVGLEGGYPQMQLPRLTWTPVVHTMVPGKVPHLKAKEPTKPQPPNDRYSVGDKRPINVITHARSPSVHSDSTDGTASMIPPSLNNTPSLDSPPPKKQRTRSIQSRNMRQMEDRIAYLDEFKQNHRGKLPTLRGMMNGCGCGFKTAKKLVEEYAKKYGLTVKLNFCIIFVDIIITINEYIDTRG